MKKTKENILLTALRLFARDGYEAVSVSTIAGELGMVKSALYRHYKNKRDIFESILSRMEEADAAFADRFEMPTENGGMNAETLRSASVAAFTLAMFDHWTEDEFASLFRKLLTVEQYRSPEMGSLYQQYLGGGPLAYMRSIFFAMTGNRSRGDRLALEFYAPMYLLYSLSDTEDGHDTARALLCRHIEDFLIKYKEVLER